MSKKIYCENTECDNCYDGICVCHELSMQFHEDGKMYCGSDTSLPIIEECCNCHEEFPMNELEEDEHGNFWCPGCYENYGEIMADKEESNYTEYRTLQNGGKRNVR